MKSPLPPVFSTIRKNTFRGKAAVIRAVELGFYKAVSHRSCHRVGLGYVYHLAAAQAHQLFEGVDADIFGNILHLAVDVIYAQTVN